MEKDTLTIEIEKDGVKSKINIDTLDPNVIVNIKLNNNPLLESVEDIKQEESIEDISLDDLTKLNNLLARAKEALNNNEYNIAINFLNEALKIDENNSQALSLKGSAYFKLNQVDTAKSIWQKALEIDPSLDEVKEILIWLDGL